VRRAENAVAALLVLASASLVAFVVLLFVDPDTQLLGLTAAAGLALIATALVLAGKRLVPHEPAVEPRSQLEDPEARDAVETRLRFPRRKLLLASGGAAGAALTAAVVAPVTALGPAVGDSIVDTPWHRGRRLVDEHGKPLTADDVAEGSFVTAFPEGADKRELGSPVEPMTAEAFILSSLDSLDATLHQVRRHVEDDRSEGDFTAYHPRLGRVLLKPSGR